MILKNLQPYSVVVVEEITMRDFLRSHVGAEGIEELLTYCDGTEEFLNSKQYIDRNTLAICENSGEAARLSDWANKHRYANDPNFHTRIRPERYEIIELSTDLVNDARLTCEDCGSDLIISEYRKSYVCEKCGKEYSLMKKPANWWNNVYKGSTGKKLIDGLKEGDFLKF
ncbi:hypothetical protein [Methanococcus maripaludis]|uniref:DNA-directed RNA polymerase subunit RPC12/RpoP n=2 Tax=Methanococcus maripaludis TaxID=39152 RepID=A0A7J9PIG6_METMI|nr:hypothetical protein [Methanococcus maripaludis]MBA2862911.1 DNA-directed RNA polymerase subunit RPC12/RpoP [Methanococcus maripaludis]